ncbi:MAG: MerR family DNA-binding transcriptional regulator [Myxococcota bacterium]
MSRRVRVEDVLVFLGVERRGFLEPLRDEGLFLAEELLPDEAEELRVAQILVQDLGVNPAGVDVALHLRRRLLALEARTRRLAQAFERDREPR